MRHLWGIKQRNSIMLHALHRKKITYKMPKKSNKELWLNRLDNIIEKNKINGDLNNERLAKEMEMSQRHFIRKATELTGLSPQKYLRAYRLRKAMSYLRNGKYKTVKETGYAVGYINISYFINQFDRKFNKRPLQVLKEHGWR